MNVQEAPIARRYAQAFLNVFIDAISLDDCSHIEMAAHFLTKHRQALFFLTLPHIEFSTKVSLLERLMKSLSVDPSINKLIKLLIRDKRLFLLPEVFEQISLLYREEKNIKLFMVMSSHTLEEKALRVVQRFLATKIGCDIVYTYKENRDLIAGIRLQSDTLLWEYSIRKQLMMMQAALIR